MGPTNIALVKLFRIDQDLREAQEKYDSASKSVRLLERRVAELTADLVVIDNKIAAYEQRLKIDE